MKTIVGTVIALGIFIFLSVLTVHAFSITGESKAYANGVTEVRTAQHWRNPRLNTNYKKVYGATNAANFLEKLARKRVPARNIRVVASGHHFNGGFVIFYRHSRVVY